MFSLILEDTLNKFFKKKIFIFFTAFAFFCAINIKEVKFFNMNMWEYILYIFTDHYYIIYFLVFSYIFLIFECLNQPLNIVMIRSKKAIKYYIYEFIAIFLCTAIYILIHLIIAICIGGFLLPHGNKFNILQDENYEIIKYIIKFSDYFKTPVGATTMVVIYLILGIFFIASIIKTCSILFDPKTTVIVAICIVLNIMIGFKMQIHESIPYIFFNCFIILHHILFYKGFKGVTVILILQIILFGFMIGLIKLWKNNKLNNSNILGRKTSKKCNFISKRLLNRKNNVIIVLFLFSYVFLHYCTIRNMEGNITAVDFMVKLLWGHGVGYLNPVEFISQLIFFIIPLYVIANFYENDKNGRDNIFTIRYCKINCWIMELQKNIFKFISIYMAFFIVISTFFFLVIGQGKGFLILGNYTKSIIEFYNYKGNVNLLILGSFVLKFLELMFLQLVFFIIYRINKNTIVAFIISILGYFCTMFSSGFTKYIPWGMSCISRIILLNINSLRKFIAIICIYVIGIVLGYIYIFNSKGGFSKGLIFLKNSLAKYKL